MTFGIVLGTIVILGMIGLLVRTARKDWWLKFIDWLDY